MRTIRGNAVEEDNSIDLDLWSPHLGSHMLTCGPVHSYLSPTPEVTLVHFPGSHQSYLEGVITEAHPRFGCETMWRSLECIVWWMAWLVKVAPTLELMHLCQDHAGGFLVTALPHLSNTRMTVIPHITGAYTEALGAYAICN